MTFKQFAKSFSVTAAATLALTLLSPAAVTRATPSWPVTGLDALLPLVDWRGVEWNDHAIRLPRSGMEIDFGGIGKEYAADRVLGLLMGTKRCCA